MKTYKIGIIGCGNIAKKMALTLGGMKHVELIFNDFYY